MPLIRPIASLLTALVLSLTAACSPAAPAPDSAPAAESSPVEASLAPPRAPRRESGSAAPRRQDPPIPPDTDIQTAKSGLLYSVLEPSQGELLPKRGDRVLVHFTGWLTDGTMFETTRGKEPAAIEVGETLWGLNRGLMLMGVGGRYKFTVPPELGYGAGGRPPQIPGNSTLIFEVEQLQGGDIVTVRYALWNISGKLLDCSERNGDHRLKSKVSKLDDLKHPFLKEAIGLMRAGAHYRFEVTPQYAFGGNPPPGIGPKSIAVWELEVEKVMQPWPRPNFAQFDESLLEKLPSGLEVAVIKQGEGPKPGVKSRVTANYIGWLVDGSVFDSSYDLGEPATLVVAELIKGLNAGLRKMNAGSIYMFRIPPPLAYGGGGQPPYIGPFATLIFRVELVSVIE
jgi:FKBP-type peptidyl-prolyl cis-trans isomerase